MYFAMRLVRTRSPFYSQYRQTWQDIRQSAIAPKDVLYSSHVSIHRDRFGQMEGTLACQYVGMDTGGNEKPLCHRSLKIKHIGQRQPRIQR